MPAEQKINLEWPNLLTPQSTCTIWFIVVGGNLQTQHCMLTHMHLVTHKVLL